jgi:hypothetical protein
VSRWIAVAWWGLLASAFFAPGVHAQQKLTEISYEIKARLDTQAKKIWGEETLRFKNESGAALKVLYLHLKPNRFQAGSIQARSTGLAQFDAIFPHGAPDGYLFVQELKLDGRPYHVGTDAHIDDTILKMNLANPIPSGNSAELTVRFFVKIPHGLERFGHYRENYFVSWWYPELAVLDRRGWHLDPFREPYQNFASYTVELTLPEVMVVGATGGLPQQETRHANGTKTLRFSVQNVHDFAWVADRRYQITETEWEGIKIRSLYLPEDTEAGRRTARYSRDALAYFSRRFGRYPYSVFTVAQVHGIPMASMEYPQLVMNGFWLYRLPKEITALDVANAHEIAHQWWFGILMNNQPDEPWLDEGFAQFAMMAYAEEKYGPKHNLLDLEQIPALMRDLVKDSIPNWREQFVLANYLTVAREGREELVTAAPREVRPGRTRLPYEKGALTLFALEYLLGREVFDKILQEYVRRFQYQHVMTADFEKVASEVSGQDLAWFFDQWLRGTKSLDVVLEGLTVQRVDEKYLHRVLVRQAGEMRMPVDVQITLVDHKTKLRQRWEAHETRGAITFITEQPAKSAAIDPDERLPDLHRENNASGFSINYSPIVDHGLFHARPDDGFYLGLQWGLPRLNLTGRLGYSLGLRRVLHSAHYERNFTFMGERTSRYSVDLSDDGHVRSIHSKLSLRFRTDPSANVAFRHELSVQEFSDRRYNVREDEGDLTGWVVSYEVAMRDRMGRSGALQLIHKRGVREWGSEYVFDKFMLEATLRRRVGWQTSLNGRLFYGWKDGREPLDTQFALQRDGGFRTFTRSDDALLALNTELQFPISQTNLMVLWILPVSVGGILFLDAAQVGYDLSEIRAEAGLGIGIGIYPQKDHLRIEYPIWVNTSADGGAREVRVRLGISF